jgi:hypothetical protein
MKVIPKAQILITPLVYSNSSLPPRYNLNIVERGVKHHTSSWLRLLMPGGD